MTTSDPGATPPASGSDPTPSRHRRLFAVVVALVVTAVAVALVLVVRGTGSGGPSGAQATISAPTTSTPASPSATSTPPSVPTQTATTSVTTPAPPSAYDQLVAFFAAARRMDEQLHTAATNIDAAGPPWYVLDEKVAQSVRAADEKNVLVTIPGGMPPELLRQVVLVYSELVSRHAAMTGFTTAHDFESEPSLPPGVGSRSSTAALLSQLKKGAEAAVRFEGDLAAAEATARSLQPFAKAALGSRADMEVALLANYVHKGNYGCGETGGAIIRTLPRIRWTSSSTGTINRLGFTIKLEPDGHYTDDPILAC